MRIKIASFLVRMALKIDPHCELAREYYRECIMGLAIKGGVITKIDHSKFVKEVTNA